MNTMDGMFESLLRPVINDIYPCNIDSVRNNTQKEVRIIDTLEPVLNQHRLVVDYGSCKQDVTFGLKDNNMMYSLLFQLSHITKDRQSLQHDDRLDAVTMAVSYWLERNILEQNLDKALEGYKERQLNKQLKEFTKSYKTNPFYNVNSGSKHSKSLRGLKAFN